MLGFTLSLVSVSLTSHLLASPAHLTKPTFSDNSITIELFKKNDTFVSSVAFSDIQKSSLLETTFSQDFSHDLPSMSEVKVSNLLPTHPDSKLSADDIFYSPNDVEGVDDDEILSVNIDNAIPIDIETSDASSYSAEVAYEDASDNKIALLPTTVPSDTADDSLDSPWVIAQGSKHIKNKKLLEKYTQEDSNKLVSENLSQLVNTDDNNDLSYKVAERIKQSIIFPIPDEILNDENLTPTFITPKKKDGKDNKSTKDTKSADITSKSATSPSQSTKEQPLKIISKTIPTKSSAANEQQKSETSNSILSNISSWFSPSTEKEAPARPAVKKKATPLYSSQNSHSTSDSKDLSLPSNDALVSFYETIQETQKEQAANKIIPSELKLSFQPDRAEISGQTLRWLKAFAETSKEKQQYLQIRLDATAPIELQRKRLNLLYTIFMNNGVDFKKVDTVFSLTEPNTFIIRTIKIKE